MTGIIPIFDMYLSSLSMSTHFLLNAKARTLSLREIFADGEEGAYATFCKLRWPETDGEPVCPKCGSQPEDKWIRKSCFVDWPWP